jgi:phosphomannomutase
VFSQFEEQLLARLGDDARTLSALHIMPTCGTRYLRFDAVTRHWQQVYSEDITDPERIKIIDALEAAADAQGYRSSSVWGAQIEDRGSQVTFSALGQEAPLAEKQAWDPDGSKKRRLRDAVAETIPRFEVRVGGSTSIDVTSLGVDKSYGIKRLIELLDMTKKDVIFVGDRLSDGGNDYPHRVGHPLTEREQGSQRQQIGVDRPLHSGTRQPDFPLDLRHRDRHDRLVDERHRHREDHRRQNEVPRPAYGGVASYRHRPQTDRSYFPPVSTNQRPNDRSRCPHRRPAAPSTSSRRPQKAVMELSTSGDRVLPQADVSTDGPPPWARSSCRYFAAELIRSQTDAAPRERDENQQRQIPQTAPRGE